MPTESHLLMDGALHVYRRENSRYWQCSTYLGSRNHRQTTKEASLAAAKDFARDWYMDRFVGDLQRRRGCVAFLDISVHPLIAGPVASTIGPIGRAHVCTPVTNAPYVFLLLLQKTTNN